MKEQRCEVCGGTDMNLVDGFYYCVECGTQDTNAQETVVENTVLADGTFAITTSKKIRLLLQKDGVDKMSGEWHKWHTFNFILAGMVEELIAAGAALSVRGKVLWVWTRYIKVFQDKDKIGENSQSKDNINTTIFDGFQGSDSDIENEQNAHVNKESDSVKYTKDIKIITRNVLIAILYVALNLDKSDIQLSHFLKYLREGRVSFLTCYKFVPKELNVMSIPQWWNFLSSSRICYPSTVLTLANTLFKRLNLGNPLVPDMRKIVGYCITELCLPEEFKDLVFSLMNFTGLDFQNSPVSIPDYEVEAMSYILVAFKMTFGLDCDYEDKLSDAVEKINCEENYLKSYKLGMPSEKTNRLFSFREWHKYMLFRRAMLCRYYLPVAEQHDVNAEDEVYIAHLGERSTRKIKLRDEVTMDILNKIPLTENKYIIPKSEFPPSLTPRAAYTAVLVQHLPDTETKLLLSEDFTQYSLRYACVDLKLPGQNERLTGVSENGKTINHSITGSLGFIRHQKRVRNMVYVRNCENKNWLTTKPPTVEHITAVCGTGNDRTQDSNRGYDSNTDNENIVVTAEDDLDSKEDSEEENTVHDDSEIEVVSKLETIVEEDIGASIFDDTFDDVDESEKKTDASEADFNGFHFQNDNFENGNDSKSDIDQNYSESVSNLSEARFNPATFNREGTIRELIEAACKKYKAPIPREYNPRERRKRKPDLVHDGAGESKPKKRKTVKSDEAKKDINQLLSAYYTCLENDVLNQISKHVKSVVENLPEPGVEPSNIALQDIGNDGNEGGDYNEEQNTVPPETEGLDSDAVNGDTENNIDIPGLNQKSDPKFDENTYDIKQLYLKFRDEFDVESIDFDDPELNEIVDKKIKQCPRDGPIEQHPEDLKESKQSTESEDSEDEVPLSVFKLNFTQNRKKMEPLIKDRENIDDFKLWVRRYNNHSTITSHDMSLKFDIELEKNCPRSFNFVLQECAAVLETKACKCYRAMLKLEKKLIDMT